MKEREERKLGIFGLPVTVTRYSGVQVLVLFGGVICLGRMLFMG